MNKDLEYIERYLAQAKRELIMAERFLDTLELVENVPVETLDKLRQLIDKQDEYAQMLTKVAYIILDQCDQSWMTRH